AGSRIRSPHPGRSALERAAWSLSPLPRHLGREVRGSCITRHPHRLQIPTRRPTTLPHRHRLRGMEGSLDRTQHAPARPAGRRLPVRVGVRSMPGQRRPCTDGRSALLRGVCSWGGPGRSLLGRHAFRAPPSQGSCTRCCRRGGAAPPLSKNRARRQRRQIQGREARGVGELQGGRGHLPAPRWGFPHPLPHASMVSVWFAPSNPLSCLSFFALYAYHLVAERATVPPTPSGAVVKVPLR